MRRSLRWPMAEKASRRRGTSPREMALRARPVAALAADKEALAEALARALYAELRGGNTGDGANHDG